VVGLFRAFATVRLARDLAMSRRRDSELELRKG
jgi:hypothetical protein